MPKISSRGVTETVRAIADAAARWSDGDFPPRVRVTSAIEKRTGYSAPVVDFALDRLFQPLRAETLEGVIVEELGSVDAFERFLPRAGGVLSRAIGVGKVVVISSETTIGVALVPALYALCAQCEVLVKDCEDDLVRAFFATLAEESPEVAARAKAQRWTGGDASEGDLAVRLADAVVVFGRDATLAAVRASLRPGSRFLGYGHRASAGYVERRALANEERARAIARGAARDLLLYDAEGCMSLHVLFVERGGAIEPYRFLEVLGEAVREASVEFPAGRIDPRVLAYQTGAAFRAALGRGSVVRTDNGDATVVLDPPLSAPPPFLPRVLPVHAVDGPAECEEYLRSHGLPLEVLALAEFDDETFERFAALGAVRIARFGAMQSPSPALHHGGRPRIADFVRWVDVQ